MISSRRKLVFGVAAIVVVGIVATAWLVLRVSSPAPTAVATQLSAVATALRKAQALAVNEPTEPHVRAWEQAARKYRSRGSVHAAADDAIDGGNLAAARATLLNGLSVSTSAPARQDLLQRLAWVELNLDLMKEARAHADQALALDDDDERGYANALVVRHMIAVRDGDQAKIDALIEELLTALDPS